MSIPKSFLATVALIVMMSVLSMWISLFGYDTTHLVFFRLYSLITGILEFGLILLFLIVSFGYKDLIPKKTASRYYLAAFALGISYSYVQTPLNDLYNLMFGTEYKIIYNFESKGLFTWNVIASVLLGPISEEYFFRDYILKGLLKKYIPWVAIIVSTLLFASIHLPFYSLFFDFVEFNIHHAYITFFGGLIAALLYFKSGSIGPSIIFHFAWNFMVILI